MHSPHLKWRQANMTIWKTCNSWDHVLEDDQDRPRKCWTFTIFHWLKRPSTQFIRVPPYEIGVSLCFFRQNEITLWGKKRTAFFQTCIWEKSSRTGCVVEEAGMCAGWWSQTSHPVKRPHLQSSLLQHHHSFYQGGAKIPGNWGVTKMEALVAIFWVRDGCKWERRPLQTC